MNKASGKISYQGKKVFVGIDVHKKSYSVVGYQLKPKKDLIAKDWLVVFWKSVEHALCAVDFSLYVDTRKKDKKKSY